MAPIATEWLNPKASVWRYMDYERVVEMIEEQEIHFHRSDSFSDPLEGSVPRAIRDFSDKTYDEVVENSENPREKLESVFKSIRQTTFLSCWHANAGESMAMWRLYGKSDKTVAVKSTVEKLSRSIEEPDGGITLIAPVLYADYDSSYENLDPESRQTLDMVFSLDSHPQMHELYKIKEASFRHEREVRVIYQAIDAIAESVDGDSSLSSDFPFETEKSGKPIDEGFNSPVDIGELIEEIRMSPDSSSQAQRDLGRVLDDTECTSLSSKDVLPTSVPGDPIFEAGSYLFERFVKAGREIEE